MLTSKIKHARTIRALFRTYSVHEDHLDHMHLSACWTSLGRLGRESTGWEWPGKDAEALELLVQETVQKARAGEIGARQVANIAYGAVSSGKGLHMGGLFRALGTAAKWRVLDFNLQELANTAWAFAMAVQSDAQLFTELARVARRRVDFNAQQLVNTAWAFAMAGQLDAQLFKALIRVAEQRVRDFKAQGLANMAWALATAGQCDAQLFIALARMAERLVAKFTTQGLANIVWAFARAGHLDMQLFVALARVAEQLVADFTTQGLSNVLWAFAKVGHWDVKLFMAFARVAEQRRGDFNFLELGNMAWAFENMCSVKAATMLNVKHPFHTHGVDHCETSLQAFEDMAPFLDLVASQLGKVRSTLTVFDPYFCVGTMKQHLKSLGFCNVYNECEDFYRLMREDRIPPHDVLVTNPPYAEVHVQRLLGFCSTHDRPYFLLMPVYICMDESFL